LEDSQGEKQVNTPNLATELYVELKGLDTLHSDSVHLSQLYVVKLYIVVLGPLSLAL
jgi:hypothetical protein